tara:strand:+ start:228 stop:449 length:222 start_codon:yes stop_codon:yes gene_type:complete
MNPDDLTTFGFKEKNAVYEAVMRHLEAFIEAEVIAVQDRENIGEGRIHTAGRLAFGNDFRDHLVFLRNQAQQN